MAGIVRNRRRVGEAEFLPNLAAHSAPRQLALRQLRYQQPPYQATARRYRCQVACPSTGSTTTSPTSAGSDLRTNRATTIAPQTAITPGFVVTTRTEVH